VLGYHPREPPFWEPTSTRFRPWLLLLIPTLGGLLSGLVFKLAPEAEGHGTDAAIADRRYIRPRVPLVTIGSRGFGSLIGGLFRSERRLMAAGVGAGVAAWPARCSSRQISNQT
jgi:CIC family chloride channel protein